ncbi:uncharacterized protein [Ptychodera flava]|uniref:uncharacterized protein n=1 Tax=Ptychodera flava TaxID=63121 RepID=UPI003969FA5A
METGTHLLEDCHSQIYAPEQRVPSNNEPWSDSYSTAEPFFPSQIMQGRASHDYEAQCYPASSILTSSYDNEFAAREYTLSQLAQADQWREEMPAWRDYQNQHHPANRTPLSDYECQSADRWRGEMPVWRDYQNQHHLANRRPLSDYEYQECMSEVAQNPVQHNNNAQKCCNQSNRPLGRKEAKIEETNRKEEIQQLQADKRKRQTDAETEIQRKKRD